MLFSSWLRNGKGSIKWMKRITLILAVLSLLLSRGVGKAQAGPIHAEASAQVLEVIDGQGVSGWDPAMASMTGDRYASASLTLDTPPTHFASASATAQADPSKLVSVTVGAARSKVGLNPTWEINVAGAATWRDTLMVTSPSGALSGPVRLYFEVEGQIPPTVSVPFLGQPVVLGHYFVSMDARNAGYGTEPTVAFNVDEGVVTLAVGNTGYDSLSVTPSSFRVIYHLDLSPQMDPSMSFLDSLTIAYSSPNGGGAITRAADPLTISLQSVLLADGRTPESEGYSVTFGSGMASPNVSAVPEPSGLSLLGIGSLGLLGYGWRRRKRTAA